MNRQRADPLPAPSPSLSAQELSFPFLQGLSLEDSKDMFKEVEEGNEVFDEIRTMYSGSYKTKTIAKESEMKRNLQR